MSFRIRILILLIILAVGFVGFRYVYRRVDPGARERRFLQSAREYESKGKYREASIQYLNAININPRSSESHRGLGKIALKMGDPDTAYFEFQQAVGLDPSDMVSHLNYGNLLLGRTQLKEARREAEIVLAKEPQNPEAHLLMSQLELAGGNAEAAETENEKARNLAPNSPKPYIVLGGVRLKTGKFAEAEENFKKALQLSPDDVDALLGLGSVYERQQRWQEAESAYRKAIQIAPSDAAPRVSLMVQFLFQGKNDRAEEVARETKEKLSKVPAAYRMLADFYIATGQSQKALDELYVLVKAHSNDWRLKRDYVQQLIFANRLDEADAINEELLTLQGSSPQSLIQKGQIQMRRGSPQDAVVTLKTALRDQPNNYIGHFYLGVALGATGDTEGAERELQESIRLQPQGPQAQVFLSELAARTGKGALLDELSKRLVDTFPLAANSYLVRATYECSRSNWKAAEQTLRKAVQVEPTNPVPYAKLAEIRIIQKDFSGGTELLNQALDVDPNYIPALKILVALDLTRNDVAQAIDRLQSQLQKAPNNSTYHSLLGGIYFRRSQTSDALPQFQKAVELDKKNADAWELLGKTQAAMGSLDQTIATYTQWSTADPGQPASHVLLGQIWEGKGDWEKAQEEYQKALNLDEHNGLAANNLAYLLLEHNGDTKKALTLAMEARRQFPTSSTALDTMGWAYFHDGQYQLAASTLESAAKVNPKSASVHFHLGSAYQRLKDWSKASSHFEQSLALDPKSLTAPDARKALAEMKARGGTLGGQ